MEKETDPLIEPKAVDKKMREQHERSCPQCDKLLKITIGYPTWCPDCNWNLEPEETEILQWMKAQQKQDPFEKLYESIRQIRRDKIAAPVISSPGKYKITIDTVAAYCIAILIDSLLLLPIFAFFWFLRSEPTWITAAFNILPFFVISFLLWPSWSTLGSIPDDYLSPEQYPNIYGIVNRVAQSVEAPRIKRIVTDSIFTAAYGVYGLRRVPVLILGWPLLAVLNRQEKLALLGHELAHAVNRDPSRNIFVYIAIDILYSIYKAIWLVRSWAIGVVFGLSLLLFVGLFATELLPANIWSMLLSGILIALVLSLIPLLGIFGFRYFLWREHHRAEFRADWLSAQVAGTEAAISSLQKGGWGYAVAMAMKHNYRQMIRTKHYQDLISLLQKHIADAPDLERERIERVEAKQEQVINDTHPTLSARLAALEANPIHTPAVMITEEEWQAFEKELDELIIEIQKKWFISYLKIRSGAPT